MSKEKTIQQQQWTTELPTEPGWYWVHVKDKHQAAWAGKEEIIYIDVHNGNLLYESQDTYIITHWLGPLPIPEPPRE